MSSRSIDAYCRKQPCSDPLGRLARRDVNHDLARILERCRLSVRSRNAFDVVQIYPCPGHLRDPFQPPANIQKSIAVEISEIAGRQHPLHFIAACQVLTVLGIAHHDVWARVTYFAEAQTS